MGARSQINRNSVRRTSGGEFDTVIINGGVAIAGPVLNILSPMASLVAPNTLRIDNGNVTALVDAATIVGVNPSLFTAFTVTLGGNRTMSIPVPSLPISGGPPDGEKITFLIRQDGTAGRTLTWTGGVQGYRFANAISPQGVKVADFNALLAATPATGLIRVNFEYGAADARWDCIGLAGFWP